MVKMLHDRGYRSQYVRVIVSVLPEIVESFRIRCNENGVSMANEIVHFMSRECEKEQSSLSPAITHTKKRRRQKALQKVIRQIEEIKTAEEEYRDHIPEDLRYPVRYQASAHSIHAMKEAIDILITVY
ncbi:MAG: hypothetical protein FWH28_03710 [Clostridiales bacterium]|nr:hypothetical protein [Clostridiales bacterium]